jgi:hypothetical protein
MKKLLDVIKTAQLNECGGSGMVRGCGGGWEPATYFSSSNKKTNSIESKKSKNEFEKENPNVVKNYKNLYKEFAATKKKLTELSKEAKKMLKKYPELYDFMDSSKWLVI